MLINKLKRYIYMCVCLMIRDPYKRANFIKRTNHLGKQGDDCAFFIFNFGTEPHLISIGNNVVIATGVRFINHDVFSWVLSKKYKRKFSERRGNITIGNNVFIGADSRILYDVNIGSNVLVAAGSVVTKDVADGCIVGGVPAKVIGYTEDYSKKYN